MGKTQRKIKKGTAKAQRAIRVEESEMTGFTSKSPYHEDEQHLEE